MFLSSFQLHTTVIVAVASNTGLMVLYFVNSILEYTIFPIICQYMSVTIKETMVSYWTKLLKSTKEKLNKVMYIILYNLYCKDVHLTLN